MAWHTAQLGANMAAISPFAGRLNSCDITSIV
jgi:hypothetical protein